MPDRSASRDIVLVVDDNPDTLGFLTATLEGQGAMVLVATGGVQALAIVERITPDVVLMDAVMPGMDGFETCRRLKRLAATADVPIIFMTGLSETEHIVEGLEAGGVDYVTKPIVLDELTARIRVHLANARRERSARMALDTAGRFLLATDAAGTVAWATPQAARLLAEVAPSSATAALADGVRDRVAAQIAGAEEGAIAIGRSDDRTIAMTALGRVGDDEWLWRLTVETAGGEEAALRRRYALTGREAEVLLWIARGKANRDIGEILGLSPRTVNKHLEQVYAKLGVENRASAAVMALKAIEAG
ncbi:response regulator transcription factor [Siculibacillus lacustris]|uniref:Response regulator transcription factor n=1 Tax=Siculibacillus lacustris TaxID=1549641 RepID=A0A4Q9VE24_9HYPH|nr:response regulator transcription factor [Siculibacillus lacustris]TBW33005.1 response regulator transcription factor [Siculibacillus lacustris]